MNVGVTVGKAAYAAVIVVAFCLARHVIIKDVAASVGPAAFELGLAVVRTTAIGIEVAFTATLTEESTVECGTDIPAVGSCTCIGYGLVAAPEG